MPDIHEGCSPDEAMPVQGIGSEKHTKPSTAHQPIMEL